MHVVTRFAPSPTGYLHIGGARTALFNWLFARRHGGTFLLRIEDTDRQRSTPDAIEKIFEGMRWLELDWDGAPVMQFARAARHAEVARQLLAEGKAYQCYATSEELDRMREEQRAAGKPMRYNGLWRDRDPAEAPADLNPVIRLKAPQEGETIIEDMVQGPVRVANEQLDDMVLLRSDGTPTYMLSVVVDDHDMGITHVIRGDDHLTNAFRQTQLYRACGWTPPVFAHIPLIHGADGGKLSKRHGARGGETYRHMGSLPEAMRNYLLRLGWSHGDDEIISTEQAVAWFSLESVGRSAARFDFAKLGSVNGHYMRQADDARLVDLILPLLADKLGQALDVAERARLIAGMSGLKERAKTLVELADSAAFYVAPRPIATDDKAAKALEGDALEHLAAFGRTIAGLEVWNQERLEQAARVYAENTGLKLGKLAQPVRAAVTGSTVSPPIFEVMQVLGKAETLARINDKLEDSQQVR